MKYVKNMQHMKSPTILTVQNLQDGLICHTGFITHRTLLNPTEHYQIPLKMFKILK